MHVILFSYFFPPDTEIGGHRPARLVQGLRSLGHTVETIAFENPRASGTSNDVFRVPNSQGLLSHAIQRVLPYNDRIPWVPSAVRQANTRIATRRPAVLISTAPPFACHVAAYWLSRRHRLPWIADFRDPLSDNPFRTRKSGVLLDRLAEARMLRQASVVVMNTEAALRSVADHHPSMAHKLRLIWNGFDPEDRIEARPVSKPGKIVLTHTGSIYGHRHPGPVFQSVARLLQTGRLDPSRLEILCVGRWEDAVFSPEDPVAQQLRNMGILTVNRQGVPPAEARKIMESASHLLLMDQNEARKGLQVPGKLFEYVRIGRPILCVTHPESMCEYILERSGVPFAALDPHGPEAVFDQKVAELLTMDAEPLPYSAWFEDQFGMATQTRQWMDAVVAATGSDRE